MNIFIGMEFKNYKELCDYLNEPSKTGKSKQLQIADWERYFKYERKGHKFIITNVYEVPTEKNYRTGNNIKNIKPMIDYLQCLGYSLLDCKGMSMTNWYCEKLKLLDKNVCNLFYGGNLEIEYFCKQNKILDKILFQKYVSFTKSELKNIFVKALKYMEKKNLVEYEDGYMFIYKLGEKSKGYVRTAVVNDIITEYEASVCNEINEKYNLSNKMKGRQLLFLIYRKKELYTEFQNSVISMLMENENVLDVLNECAYDENRNYMYEVHGICGDRPLLSYHRVILIIAINEQKGDCDEFRKELCNLLRKKVRNKIWNEHFTNENGKVIYPYDNTEKIPDLLRIERLLFQVFDFEYDDDSNCDIIKYDLWNELTGGSVIENIDEGLPF